MSKVTLVQSTLLYSFLFFPPSPSKLLQLSSDLATASKALLHTVGSASYRTVRELPSKTN